MDTRRFIFRKGDSTVLPFKLITMDHFCLSKDDVSEVVITTTVISKKLSTNGVVFYPDTYSFGMILSSTDTALFTVTESPEDFYDTELKVTFKQVNTGDQLCTLSFRGPKIEVLPSLEVDE